MKSKKRVFLIISIIMLLFAIGFIWYALNHPEGGFTWSNSVTYGIYFMYIVIMIAFFVISRRKERINHLIRLLLIHRRKQGQV